MRIGGAIVREYIRVCECVLNYAMFSRTLFARHNGVNYFLVMQSKVIS